MYISLILFALMLLFPTTTKLGALTGLTLWFDTIIPTLIPYMIISNVICYFNAFNPVAKLLYPVTNKIFKISMNANYCLVLGFLCGFPMGSKVIADMLKDKKLTLNEASYLLSFCNNLSPSFLINYVGTSILLNCYKIDSHKMHIFYFIIFFSPILVSFLYRIIEKYDYSSSLCLISDSNNEAKTKSGNFIDTCILDSFQNIFKIGGYIIMFTIFSTWILNMPFVNSNTGFVLSSLLEITSGLFALKHTYMTKSTGMLLVAFLCSFGGICSIAQTCSMISKTDLKITSYIKYKLLSAIVVIFLLRIFLLATPRCWNVIF